MRRLASTDSEALGIVEDLQLGSSPTTASAPPVRETPTKLPWRRASDGAVEARCLAVPHAEHAVVLGARQALGQLAAPRGGGAELLVEARHVVDEVLLEQRAVARQLLVEPAQRGALVAGDHRPGGQAAAAVGAVLLEHQAYERLHAGEEDPALLEDVLVVEADLALGPAPRRPFSPLWRRLAAVGRAPRRRANVVSLVIGELNLPLVVPGSQPAVPLVGGRLRVYGQGR